MPVRPEALQIQADPHSKSTAWPTTAPFNVNRTRRISPSGSGDGLPSQTSGSPATHAPAL